MCIPYHGTLPISGKLTDILRVFPHNIHPFLGNISHLTPYIGNIMVTPIPFLLFFYFLQAWEICKRILPLLSGPYHRYTIYLRALPTFLGRLLKAQETCTYIYPLFLKLLKNTPYLGRLVKTFPRQTAKNTPFPEKIGIRMRPSCTIEWGRPPPPDPPLLSSINAIRVTFHLGSQSFGLQCPPA